MKYWRTGASAVFRGGIAAKSAYNAYNRYMAGGRTIPRTRSGFPYRKPASGTRTLRQRKRRARTRSGFAQLLRSRTGTIQKRKRKRPDAVFRASQLQYAKRRTGVKRSGAYVRKRLVDSSIHTMRLRHSNITDWTGDSGATGYLRGQSFLAYQASRDGNPNLTSMPVRLFNLFSTAQNPTTNVAAPLWELVYDTSLASYRWFSGYGRNNLAVADQKWQLENNSAYGTSVGGIRDKGFIRWSRARLLFYGKQQQDTKITVSLVQFAKDQNCPEFYPMAAGYTDPVDLETKEMLDRVVKPLINNPIASQIQNQKPMMKVLKKYTIDIDATLSIDNDKDVDRRILDIFNRWDRMLDFTPENPNPTNLSALEDPNKWPLPVTSNTNYPTVPKRIRDSVYVLITSHQPNFLLPDAAGPPETRGEQTTASWDWNIQTCWKDLSDG